ncbi:MAG TPA: FRG domain-containing protein, partial [Micropepsaceae bacterium]|nr:FRG domain-containing protein [Micropepsaceae bacterium]
MKRIELKRWQDFRDWVDSDQQILPVYWRGQKDSSWPLASRFERILLNMCGGTHPEASQLYPYGGRYKRDEGRIWTQGFYKSTRDRYLVAFKQAASGLRGPNPAVLCDDQWWALGRHNGLITP